MAIEKENHECGGSVRRILAAARFAAEKHAPQRRKGENGEPYFNHLLEVAELIASSSRDLDVELVMAAFLHDTVEDTGVTLQELEHHFGKDVAALVAEVTDDKSLPKETRKQLQVRHTPEKSARAGHSNWPIRFQISVPSFPARPWVGAWKERGSTSNGRDR